MKTLNQIFAMVGCEDAGEIKNLGALSSNLQVSMNRPLLRQACASLLLSMPEKKLTVDVQASDKHLNLIWKLEKASSKRTINMTELNWTKFLVSDVLKGTFSQSENVIKMTFKLSE